MLACNTPLHGVLEAVVCGSCALGTSAALCRHRIVYFCACFASW